VNLVKLGKIAISPVLGKGLAEFEVVFPSCSSFSSSFTSDNFPGSRAAQLGTKRRVALGLTFFVPAIVAIAETDSILTVASQIGTHDCSDSSYTRRGTAARDQGLAVFHGPGSATAHAWFREQLRMAARTRRSEVIGKATALDAPVLWKPNYEEMRGNA
jgi:hypothetical protein